MKLALSIALTLFSGIASAQVVDYKVAGDGIPKPLTATPGNAARGKALLAKRETANCLTCHSINDKDLKPGGKRGPALDGIGAQLTASQLRLSVVDYTRISRGTDMPTFHKAARGSENDQPILSAQEIEDVVAFLTTLRYK